MRWPAERVIVATYYLAKTIKRACKAGDNKPPGTNCPVDAWPFGSGQGWKNVCSIVEILGFCWGDESCSFCCLDIHLFKNMRSKGVITV